MKARTSLPSALARSILSACVSWNRGDRRGSSIPCEGNASSAPWTKVAGSTVPALEVGEATTSGRWLPPPPVSTVVVPLSCLPRPMTPESRDRECHPGSTVASVGSFRQHDAGVRGAANARSLLVAASRWWARGELNPHVLSAQEPESLEEVPPRAVSLRLRHESGLDVFRLAPAR